MLTFITDIFIISQITCVIMKLYSLVVHDTSNNSQVIVKHFCLFLTNKKISIKAGIDRRPHVLPYAGLSRSSHHFYTVSCILISTSHPSLVVAFV